MQIDHLRTAIAEQVPRLQKWEVDGLAKKLESAGLIAQQWIPVTERLPELKDDSVLIYFENGAIETVHIEDYFKPITNGVLHGEQRWTMWYAHHNPKVIAWQPLPETPQ